MFRKSCLFVVIGVDRASERRMNFTKWTFTWSNACGEATQERAALPPPIRPTRPAFPATPTGDGPRAALAGWPCHHGPPRRLSLAVGASPSAPPRRRGGCETSLAGRAHVAALAQVRRARREVGPALQLLSPPPPHPPPNQCWLRPRPAAHARKRQSPQPADGGRTASAATRALRERRRTR